MKILTIGVTGKKESQISGLVDISIKAESNETNHIQEMHIAIGQLICGMVESHFFKK